MRKTRLVAACCHVKDASKGDERVEKNRRMILECLDRAKALRPDFVVFSEIALQLEAAPTTEAMKHAEPYPGFDEDREREGEGAGELRVAPDVREARRENAQQRRAYRPGRRGRR